MALSSNIIVGPCLAALLSALAENFFSSSPPSLPQPTYNLFLALPTTLPSSIRLPFLRSCPVWHGRTHHACISATALASGLPSREDWGAHVHGCFLVLDRNTPRPCTTPSGRFAHTPRHAKDEGRPGGLPVWATGCGPSATLPTGYHCPGNEGHDKVCFCFRDACIVLDVCQLHVACNVIDILVIFY